MSSKIDIEAPEIDDRSRPDDESCPKVLTLPGIELPSKEEVLAEQVRELYDHWRRVTGKKRAKLDDRRRQWFKRGIKDWGLADAKRAITGMGEDDWAMGLVEPHDGRKRKAFNEPEHVFRKASRTEEFLGLAPEPRTEHEVQSERWAEWKVRMDDGVAARAKELQAEIASGARPDPHPGDHPMCEILRIQVTTLYALGTVGLEACKEYPEFASYGSVRWRFVTRRYHRLCPTIDHEPVDPMEALNA